MSIINNHTDKTIQWTTPAATLPADAKLCGIIRRTLTGDAVLASTQLGAGDFFINVTMTALSDMRLPSVECSYSYRTLASIEDRAVTHLGSTTNTISSKPVTATAGQVSSASISFTSDGSGNITVVLRGSGNGIYQVEAKIFKIVQEKAHV
jgi:hypothetical protein